MASSSIYLIHGANKKFTEEVNGAVNLFHKYMEWRVCVYGPGFKHPEFQREYDNKPGPLLLARPSLDSDTTQAFQSKARDKDQGTIQLGSTKKFEVFGGLMALALESSGRCSTSVSVTKATPGQQNGVLHEEWYKGAYAYAKEFTDNIGEPVETPSDQQLNALEALVKFLKTHDLEGALKQIAALRAHLWASLLLGRVRNISPDQILNHHIKSRISEHCIADGKWLREILNTQALKKNRERVARRFVKHGGYGETVIEMLGLPLPRKR